MTEPDQKGTDVAEKPENVRKIIDSIVASAGADEEFAQRLRANPIETLKAAGIPPQDAATLLDFFAEPSEEVDGYMFDTLGHCSPSTHRCDDTTVPPE